LSHPRGETQSLTSAVFGPYSAFSEVVTHDSGLEKLENDD